MPCTLPAALADAAVCRGSFHAVLRTDVPDAVFSAFSAGMEAQSAVLAPRAARKKTALFMEVRRGIRPAGP